MESAPLPETELAKQAQADALPLGAAIYAEFWRRWAAEVVDISIFFPWLVIVMRADINSTFNVFVFFSVPWLYFALLESSPWQATLGKRIFGIKAVDMYGRRIGFWRAAWRFFIRILPLLILLTEWPTMPDIFAIQIVAVALVLMALVVFPAGHMRAGWDKRKQTFHDKLASVCVVFKAVQPGQPLPTQRPPLPWYGWAINAVSCFGVAMLTTEILFTSVTPYTNRSWVTEGFLELSLFREEINNEGCHPGSRPSSNEKIAAIEISDAGAGRCSVTATFHQFRVWSKKAKLSGGKIYLTRDADGQWTCGSDLPNKYLPVNCRRSFNTQ